MKDLRAGPKLSRAGLGNVLMKNKRISGDEQNSTQNCTTMRVLVTRQHWTAFGPEQDLQRILCASLKKGKSVGVDNIPAELVQAVGDHDR